MTPLVDVVMVILIFLMLAGSFGSGEKYMIASSSVRGPSPRIRTDDTQPITIELRVNENGGVRVPWQPGVAIADNVTLKVELEQRLAKVVRENAALGTTVDKVELILRPDAGVEWEKLAPVYAAGLGAKYEKIGFGPAR